MKLLKIIPLLNNTPKNSNISSSKIRIPAANKAIDNVQQTPTTETIIHTPFRTIYSVTKNSRNTAISKHHRKLSEEVKTKMDNTIYTIPNDDKRSPYTDMTTFPSSKIDCKRFFKVIDEQITVRHDTTPTKLFNNMKYQKLDHTVTQTIFVPNTTVTKQQSNTNFDMLATQIVDLNNKFDRLMESLQRSLTSTDGNKVTPKMDTTTKVEIVLNNTKRTTMEDAQQHQRNTPPLSKISTLKETPINQWNKSIIIGRHKTKVQICKESPSKKRPSKRDHDSKKRNNRKKRWQTRNQMNRRKW
jgi:hypothetical protein